MKSLVERMREQRMIWVELDSTHKVRVLPPTDLQVMKAMTDGGQVIDANDIASYVHDWSGFTEEDFLGKGIGSTDAMPLDRAALNELLSNDVDWVSKLIGELQDALIKRSKKGKEDAKNSEAS